MITLRTRHNLHIMCFAIFLQTLFVMTNSKYDFCDAEVENCDHIKVDYSKCKVFKKEDFGPNSPSIFYGNARGRIGNQLLGYALLSQFERSLGVKSYIDLEMHRQLNQFFAEDFVKLPILEDEFCNPKDIPWESYHGHFRDIYNDPKYRKGKFIKTWPGGEVDKRTGKLSTGYRPEEHLSNEQEEFQQAYLKYFRENLEFLPKIKTDVRITLKQIAKKMGLKPKQLTYIGVHDRRTDHLEFMEENYGMKPLPADYIPEAMEYFREEYDNPVFVYVSDDMEYGKTHYKDDHGDLFFAGSGDPHDTSSVGFDLALLMACNHTIITRGTFSMWAALLAGGEYYTEYGTIMPPDLMYE